MMMKVAALGHFIKKLMQLLIRRLSFKIFKPVRGYTYWQYKTWQHNQQ